MATEKSVERGTPRAGGYRMPAEWAPHRATWIAWPHNPEDWPGKFSPIPWVYTEVVRHLAVAEDVEIVVDDAVMERSARRALQRAGASVERVHYHRWPTNRVWTRDSGPIFVRRLDPGTPGPGIGLTNWKFNAWARYDDWQLDDELPGQIAQQRSIPQWSPTLGERRVVLEGGSIDVNGSGILMTTEECLLSGVQARNPGLSREDLESVLREYLGVEQVLWLGRGIAGDDTHGHVDDVARFVDESTIVAAVEPAAQDPNHGPLAENLERLRRARTRGGGSFRIVELPMPAPVSFRGQRLPASYANFYIANGLVLVPTFNDRSDRRALEILAGALPGREVIGIHCRDFIWGLGTIHCMTQQEPATLRTDAGSMPTADRGR